ncbi:hypothetical protein CDAR_224261 [Caerostris darwini]|uniref:Uncharacterized protein n=1 Tax=Caerostris darwini TaxID=1538125 RepID=A0AAV4QA11_9ARAC|nr:hypothetical protein CDAR_224261 [Caerostris darwini]
MDSYLSPSCIEGLRTIPPLFSENKKPTSSGSLINRRGGAARRKLALVRESMRSPGETEGGFREKEGIRSTGHSRRRDIMKGPKSSKNSHIFKLYF